MKNLVFVDVEADGPCPAVAKMTEFGAVIAATKVTFRGLMEGSSLCGPRCGTEIVASPETTMLNFAAWLQANIQGRPVFVSDNPAFDWQWINDAFWRYLGQNPFGHSARRISDFYAGLRGDFHQTQAWKQLRITPHDHNPVHDALGNLEAFERILKGER